MTDSGEEDMTDTEEEDSCMDTKQKEVNLLPEQTLFCGKSIEWVFHAIFRSFHTLYMVDSVGFLWLANWGNKSCYDDISEKVKIYGFIVWASPFLLMLFLYFQIYQLRMMEGKQHNTRIVATVLLVLLIIFLVYNPYFNLVDKQLQLCLNVTYGVIIYILIPLFLMVLLFCAFAMYKVRDVPWYEGDDEYEVLDDGENSSKKRVMAKMD